MLLLFSFRVADRPPHWERTIHSVYCARSRDRLPMCMFFFSFSYREWDVGFDSISSYSLPMFYFTCYAIKRLIILIIFQKLEVVLETCTLNFELHFNFHKLNKVSKSPFKVVFIIQFICRRNNCRTYLEIM